MALQYRTQGFVFKKEDRSEADRIFSIFTKEYGRVEVVGKSIRKITSKLRGNIELFSFSEIDFIQGKNKKTLTDTLYIQRHKNIASPEKMMLASAISILLDNFLRGEEKDEVLFNLLQDTFKKINTYTCHQLLYLYFLWNFLSLLGHGPQLSNCVTCNNALHPEQLFFSNREGGVLCKNCAADKEGLLTINADTIKIVRLLLKKDFDTLLKLRITQAVYHNIKEISDTYHHYLLDTYS